MATAQFVPFVHMVNVFLGNHMCFASRARSNSHC